MENLKSVEVRSHENLFAIGKVIKISWEFFKTQRGSRANPR